MNCATSAHDPNNQTTTIAVGLNQNCQLYKCQLATELVSTAEEAKENGVINRKNPSTKDVQSRITFQVTPLKSVQTDFKWVILLFNESKYINSHFINVIVVEYILTYILYVLT